MKDLPFDPKTLARRDDPPTSHEAAASAGELRAKHHVIILSAFEQGLRLASQQVADRVPLAHDQVWRRMKELETADLLVRTTERHKNRSGRMAYRYELPPKTVWLA